MLGGHVRLKFYIRSNNKNAMSTSIPSTGAFSFSQLRNVFAAGSTGALSLSHFYSNSAKGYTTGVTGIPASGNAFALRLFKGKSKSQPPGLYEFSSHTFTNAGATGRNGPTLSQCRSAYSGASWAQDTVNNYLNMTTQGIQQWKVPATGSYTITVKGAKGGGNANIPYAGGQGGSYTGTLTLTQGDVLHILVGQRGGNYDSTNQFGGGGGGTFVALNSWTTNSLIAAVGGGGGGGGGPWYDGSNTTKNATSSTSGVSSGYYSGGSGGSGGSGDGDGSDGSGGAGWTGAGRASTYSSYYPRAVQSSNGVGSTSPYGDASNIGGFGGGGSGWGSGGGGGGYSGGGGGRWSTSSMYGGGGGSFMSASWTNTSFAVHNDDHGSVTITPNISIGTAPIYFTPTNPSLYRRYNNTDYPYFVWDFSTGVAGSGLTFNQQVKRVRFKNLPNFTIPYDNGCLTILIFKGDSYAVENSFPVANGTWNSPFTNLASLNNFEVVLNTPATLRSIQILGWNWNTTWATQGLSYSSIVDDIIDVSLS